MTQFREGDLVQHRRLVDHQPVGVVVEVRHVYTHGDRPPGRGRWQKPGTDGYWIGVAWPHDTWIRWSDALDLVKVTEDDRV